MVIKFNQQKVEKAVGKTLDFLLNAFGFILLSFAMMLIVSMASVALAVYRAGKDFEGTRYTVWEMNAAIDSYLPESFLWVLVILLGLLVLYKKVFE